MEKIVEFKNINLKYADKFIFKDFNFSIHKNDKILLNGKSGTGKTTLIKMICGFIIPENGNIYYKNELIDYKNIHSVRNNIAYVSQDVDLPEIKVIEALKEIYSYKKNRDLIYSEEKFFKYLDFFNLNNTIINKNIKELSGGERQRLGIIIALLLDRELLLLDEITSGLDEQLKIKIIEYFSKLEKTIIIISHDTHWKNAKLKELRWE